MQTSIVVEAAQPGGGQRILLIEDDVDLRRMVREILRKQGYEVLQASHGLEALVMVDKEVATLDLLIVDIMMPELDGLSFVKAIKSRADTRRIPVMFVTARSDPRSIAQGVHVGAKYYLTKPFTIDNLLAKVKLALLETRAVGGGPNEP